MSTVEEKKEEEQLKKGSVNDLTSLWPSVSIKH
jgi:hypothetical protein